MAARFRLVDQIVFYPDGFMLDQMRTVVLEYESHM